MEILSDTPLVHEVLERDLQSVTTSLSLALTPVQDCYGAEPPKRLSSLKDRATDEEEDCARLPNVFHH